MLCLFEIEVGWHVNYHVLVVVRLKARKEQPFTVTKPIIIPSSDGSQTQHVNKLIGIFT